MDFPTFFRTATGHEPRPYQSRLACGLPDRAEPASAWLRRGTAPESRLIDIPTGLGKTAAVVLAWLWNRLRTTDSAPANRSAHWPRRLVYCLPMRSLVEQTRDEVRAWLDRLWENRDLLELSEGARTELRWLAGDGTEAHPPHAPVVLMGGESLDPAGRDWDIHPERPSLLIGTQDMLLSRALNRGYGMARARWPMHFGLLNTDALWVMDEVQLMDVGLTTSVQLQAFRQVDQQLGRELPPSVTWWMSATLQARWLETVDSKALVNTMRDGALSLRPEERVGPLWQASKPCETITVPDEKSWAARIWQEHSATPPGPEGRITLVVVNTVRTARRIHQVLDTKRRATPGTAVELRLLHSQYRPLERLMWRRTFLHRDACLAGTDRILVATQVVEAGVDLSSTTLFTELSPWASLVQRFGRAARYGGMARVFVVDRRPDEKSALPYALEEINAARNALTLLSDVSLPGLTAFHAEHPELSARLLPFTPQHVLLRRELDDLFDTTPDLSGADLDISRFIRSGPERDVLVFWRPVPARGSPDPAIEATADELCRVPIGEAQPWILQNGARGRSWVWDYLDATWRPCSRSDVYPGQVILVAHDAGGYDPSRGWTGECSDQAFETAGTTHLIEEGGRADALLESERTSEQAWQTIAEHGAQVAEVIRSINESLALPPQVSRILQLSGLWHDVGKAHPSFNGSISTDTAGHPGTADLAKAPSEAWLPPARRYPGPDGGHRRGFRHELASTLAIFAIVARHQPTHAALLGPHLELLRLLGQESSPPGTPLLPTPPEQEILSLDASDFDLIAYLVCAHHGKVRTAWHTSPVDQEFPDRDGRGLPIHGVREGDVLADFRLPTLAGDIHPVPACRLALTPAAIGVSPLTGSSWAERMIGLRATYGPFALAYLETLLRSADARASRSAAPNPQAVAHSANTSP